MLRVPADCAGTAPQAVASRLIDKRNRCKADHASFLLCPASQLCRQRATQCASPTSLHISSAHSPTVEHVSSFKSYSKGWRHECDTQQIPGFSNTID